MPTVFITGANRGLGLEFVRQYAKEGWRVIATCRNAALAGALRDLDGEIDIYELDVTNSASIHALARTLAHEIVDVMIANAGVMPSPRHARPDEIQEAAWLEAFRVNTIAPLMCASAFLAHVSRSRERKIIAMSSWNGSISLNTAGAHYVYRASKSALNAVWRSFALDNPGIIAAVLSPGALRTDMTRYDSDRWSTLPEPAESISRLRGIIATLTQQDTGSFFHFNGERLTW